MASFLIMDTALAMALARRLRDEGHKVFYWVNWARAHPEIYETTYGKGLFEEWGVKKVEGFLDIAKSVDCVVSTDVGFGQDVDGLREDGIKVFGAGAGVARLELDRKVGKQVMRDAGIQTPHSEAFQDVKKAIQTVQNGKVGYCVKVSEMMAKGTYVGRAPQDTLDYLEKVKEKAGDKAELILEEKIEGVEMAIGGFFDGKKFIQPLCLNFEEKRLVAGGQGALTGEMGTSLRYVMGGKFFDETLAKLEGILAEGDRFRGYFDINAIVNEDGIFGIEFTARFGYPLLLIQMALHKDGVGDLLMKCAFGEKDISPQIMRGWAVGVTLNIGSYPFDECFEQYDWEVVNGIPEAEENGCDIQPFGLVLEDGIYKVLPGMGRILCSNGVDERLPVARRNALDAFDYVKVNDGHYRNDIGMRVTYAGERLKKLGYFDDDLLRSVEEA